MLYRCRASGLLGPARGPGAHESLPQDRLHPRVREGSRGHDSRAGANLPGEGPRPLGSAGLTSPMPWFGTTQDPAGLFGQAVMVKSMRAKRLDLVRCRGWAVQLASLPVMLIPA